MLGRNKKITRFELPRLHGRSIEYDEIKFEIKKKRKLKRIYVAYIFTVATIFVLCISLLLLSAFGGVSGAVVGFWSGIIEHNFPDFDFSWLGNNNSYEDNSESEETKGPSRPTVSEPSDSETDTKAEESGKQDKDGLYDFDYSAVPKGETPIVPMDLSLSSYGSSYIHNSTGLSPDTEALLKAKLGYGQLEYLSVSTAPTVLIIHTHGTEAYIEDGAISYKDDGGELARSTDLQKNVVAVGAAFSSALREKGIYSVHCDVMHDELGYKEAYSRAEETIRLYLSRYPTIKLVVDIHRDSIISSEGELIRPVTEIDGNAAAQIMCVVGSSWGGEANDRWEANLALALKFRKALNDEYGNICRPPYLKASTYNQEIAPYSLLLEIGASGNSLCEALEAASAAANAISEVFAKK